MSREEWERRFNIIEETDRLKKELLDLRNSFTKAYNKNPNSEILEEASRKLDLLYRTVMGKCNEH